MNDFLPPVVAVLTASIGEFSAKMGEAKGEMAEVGGSSAKMGALGKTALLGLAAGAVAVGVESVKMASSFQSTMELIATQAHAGQSEVDNMSKSVLALAPTVGIGPEKLAEGLYHVESTGLRGQAAMDVLKASAQEAALGMADFDSVTYAMSGVMSIAMGDVKSAADGVAYLNTIVGTGDMRMQDLANAIGTGVLPVFKVAGLGMKDFGAAITVMTDNAMPAEVAANHLKTAVQLLQNQSGPATKALAQIGIQQGQLASDLRKPDGFLVAIEDVKKHLEESGKTASEQGQILSKAFGGARSAATIEEMVSEIDKLKGKYGEMGTVGERAAQQQKDWEATQQTFAQKMKEVGAQFQVWAIQIGQILLPILSKLADWFIGSIKWLNEHKLATQVLVTLLGILLAGAALSALGALGKLAAGVIVGPIKAFGSLIGVVGDVAVAVDKGLGIAASYVLQWASQLWGWLSTTGAAFARTAGSAVLSAARTSAAWIAESAKTVAQAGAQFVRFVAATILQNGRVVASAALSAALTSAAWLASAVVMAGRVIAQAAIWVAATLVQYAVVSAAAIVSAAATVAAWVAANAALIISTGGIILLLGAVVLAVYYLATHWKEVWHDIQAVAETVGNAVRNAWNAVIDWFKQVPGWVGGIFSGAWNWLVNTGWDIIRGLWNGIKAAGSWLWGMVQGWAQSLINGIKSFFGIASPSTITHEMGGFLVQGLANGILANTHLAVGATTAMVAQVLGAGTGLQNQFAGLGSVVKYGSVSESTWNQLLKAGWKGDPNDQMEALYRPQTTGASPSATQINITMNPRDVQQFIQQGVLRKDLRNTGNGLTVGSA